MSNTGFIQGFSKLNRDEKLLLAASRTSDKEKFLQDIKNLQHPDPDVQEILDSFSENTISNFPLPFGIAPNFLINSKDYILPMVIEESSVVAAASSAARFWYDKGGFRAEVKEMTKVGQLNFLWKGDPIILKSSFEELKKAIYEGTSAITAKMEKRGGGIRGIELIDLSSDIDDLFQLRFNFNTADSMGANFINSVLENSGRILENYFNTSEDQHSSAEVLMAILSNYTPECLVKVELQCPVDNLKGIPGAHSGKDFARRFIQAIQLATIDVYRAVTHNKGIYNGIDAVVVATGNDSRAVEAAGHAYASRKGNYSSLSYAEVSEGEFVHGLELPLALGTVGGLTTLHPLAKWSFDLLGNPGAEELMMITGAAGLANNFSAVRSLVTVGIQKGHMKMHLENIMAFLGATLEEKVKIRREFESKTVSQTGVEEYLKTVRSTNE
jgi:hydroxymethylglutaryl-CoA reductase